MKFENTMEHYHVILLFSCTALYTQIRNAYRLESRSSPNFKINTQIGEIMITVAVEKYNFSASNYLTPCK